MSHSLSIEAVLELIEAGFSADEIRVYASASAPAQASAPVKAAKQPKAKASPKGNSFYQQVIKARIPCAYGVAKCGFFAPKGVGSRLHTTCPKGRKALAAAR